MKELTIEEKAKAYDEALEIAKKNYDTAQDLCNGSQIGVECFKNTLTNIFPKLKESEDELKWLTEFIRREAYYLSMDIRDDEDRIKLKNLQKSLTWLEKQGEHADFLSKIQVGDKVTRNEGGVLVNISQLERVAKPRKVKPADKVEPKFHKDEWIIHQGTENIYQVVAVIDNQYQLKYGGTYTVQKCADVDKIAHLWTIQDAKDGDVLASELCDSIILFRGIKDNNIDFYCDYDFSKINVPGDRFAINDGEHYGNVKDSKDIHPATKEQRDTLMKAMADVGYTFDFEKKELKKIEPAEWSEDDESMLECALDMVEWYIGRNETKCRSVSNWLKSLKQRIGG